MKLLDLPTEILEEILGYTVCMKGWRPYPYGYRFLAKRTVCRTFDIIVSRCTVRRLDLSYLAHYSGWRWSIETIAWILATKVAMSRDDDNGLLGMIRETGTMLGEVIKGWEDSTAHEPETRIKRSNTPYFMMDLWKEISGVVVANQGIIWVVNELIYGSTGEKTMDAASATSQSQNEVPLRRPVADSDILPILAWYGNDAIIRSFITERQADINASSGLFGRPLYIAAIAGHSRIVSLLLERGARANAEGGLWHTPLLASIRHNRFPEIVKALLSAGADVNLLGGEYDQPPLIAAVKEDAEDIMELILKSENVDATWKDSYGWTALHDACELGRAGMVRALLEHGAIDPNEPDNDSRTPLKIALEFDHADVVELLLAKGANINVVDARTGETTLITLAQSIEAEAVADYEPVPRAALLILARCEREDRSLL